MFDVRIDDAPFLSQEMEPFCSGIASENAPSFDNTFVATARALLYKRIGKDMVFVHTIRRNDCSAGRILQDFDGMGGDTRLIICMPRTDTEAESLADLESNGFRKIEKVSLFFKKVMAVYCYVDDATKRSVVILDNANLQKYHYLQTAMLNFFPWYYEPGSEISDEEKAFIRSLGQRDKDVYLRTMQALVPKDLREITIRKLFENFENQFSENKLACFENEAEDIRHRISNLYNSLRAKTVEFREKMIYIEALRDKIASGENCGELMEYLLRNKKVVGVSGSGGNYSFFVKSFLSDWDEDEADKIIENTRSYLYYNMAPMFYDNWKRLFRAIFIDRKIKINTCACFSFSSDGHADAISGAKYPTECGDCLPNPHIHHYYCTGSFYDNLSQCASNYDYIGVIEVCISSTQNLNFSDGTVLRDLSEDIVVGCDDKFLTMPDGSVVSPREAMDRLKEAEGNNNG